MLRVHKVQQELSMFERTSSIIKDGKALAFDYVPSKIVHRDGQMQRMETLFRPMAFDNVSCTAVLHGSVGTGKTVTAKRFCEDLRAYCNDKGRSIDIVFVNCRIRNTEHSVLLQILRHYNPGYPDRGFSVEEMSRSVRRHLEDRPSSLVLVLDEIDMLLKAGHKDLIYLLSRFTEEIRGKSCLSMIMISQDNIVKMLDAASISTFKRANTVQFDRYSRDELRDIADLRSQEALADGTMSGEILDMIADISKDFGDARLTIELIEKAALIAEEGDNGIITADDVRSANAMIYSDVSESKLKALEFNRKLALLAISRSMKGEPYVSLTVSERTYAVVCEEYGQVARKHTQFWTYVQELERQNLLETSVRMGAEGGRVTYITIPNIPPKSLAKKIEEMLDTAISTEEQEY